ncbi:MAG: S8 family serine peptidase, partial [Candidatus Eisenbacteria bacterium]|nr:S8 family serine peptidase [Candidatus Latescibacterota bacterium]MBD3301058.1 S8 family serine peptidase [Candidatus Eisenbacteria bacterium]
MIPPPLVPAGVAGRRIPGGAVPAGVRRRGSRRRLVPAGACPPGDPRPAVPTGTPRREETGDRIPAGGERRKIRAALIPAEMGAPRISVRATPAGTWRRRGHRPGVPGGGIPPIRGARIPTYPPGRPSATNHARIGSREVCAEAGLAARGHHSRRAGRSVRGPSCRTMGMEAMTTRSSRIALLVSTALILVTGATAHGSSPAPGTFQPPSTDPAPGRVIFQITPAAFDSADHRPELHAQGRTGLAALDQRLAAAGSREIAPVFNLEINREAKSEVGLDRIFFAFYDGAIDPETLSADLGALPEIEYAEPDGIWTAFEVPNDPLYPDQWAHDNQGQAIDYYGDEVGTPDCDTDTDQAWDLETGDPNLILAIIDTGCDLNHPEYSSRLVQGYDFVNNDWDPSDDGNHGTACAGIAVAAGNNNQGIAGVAWQVKLMPVKVLNGNGGGTWTDVADGIEFAADNGARILSLSLGGGHSSTVENAVDYAYGQGCALFCASGNGNNSSLSYPARYSNTIAVGALSPCCERKSPNSCDGEYWWGSNYGNGLDFLTPGTRIHTTDRLGGAGYGGGDYISTFNGTSSATPHAAGIGALVWSADPSLSNTELRNVLQASCDDLGSNGYDQFTGYGKLNAYLAVSSVVQLDEGACCYPDGSCQYVVESECNTGDWRVGEDCNPNPCPQPMGACCYADGSCQYVVEDECNTGDWRVGEDCDPNPCPQPMGACCYA